MAIISDARLGSKSDHSLITERLLSISGEDLQNVDRKYMSPWSGQLSTRFCIFTNELPRLADSSGALASRFVVLMLEKSFYNRENPKLTEELTEELPAIFNWSLDGLQRLRGRGRFQSPATSREAIQELEDLASPVGAFMRDRCAVGADLSVAAADLYRAYRLWCEEHGRQAINQQLFGRDLRAVRPGIHRRRLGAERVPTYVGIGLGHSRDSRGNEHCSSHPKADFLASAPQSSFPKELREPPLCDHCGKPGPELEAAYGGVFAHLHRSCSAAWQAAQDLDIPPFLDRRGSA